MPNDLMDDQALRARGLTLMAEGRYGEALPVWQQLARLEPGHSPPHVNLGTVLRSLGRHDEALLAYATAAALGERSANFFYNVGLLHQDRGDYESARLVLADALKAAPDDAEICCQYAQCCYESLRIEEAVAALAGWRDLNGLNGEQLATIALLLLTLGEADAAGEAAQRAGSELKPSATTLLRLAQIEERSNRVTAAQATLQRLRSHPDGAALGADLQLLEAQLALREGQHEQAAALFSRLAAACPEPHRRHLYLYPLAKALDAGRHFDEARARLVEAHEAQILHLRRTNPAAANLREPPLLITRHSCDRGDIAAWDESAAPPAAASPVFIVAFPRSGTTLLEQMLDAHPALVSMDEQPYLQQVIDQVADLGVAYPSGLARLGNEQLDELRAHYWSLTRRKVQLAPGQRLIDKNPLNLLRLPAIRRLFPHARVLLAIRHPCDVVLSCYMQHFRAPEFALLCRDLPTLARGYRRSFDFWYQQAALLQPDVREIRYETFVDDFEAQAREIAAFLGVEWHDALLAPGAHARAKGFISTPSYAQVIEPVHRRAVGRWKPYAAHFAEVLDELQPYLDRWGYAT